MWSIPIANISVPLCFMDDWHFTLLSSPFSFSPWMTSRNLHCSWIFQWLLLRHFYYNKWKRFGEGKNFSFILFFRKKTANFFYTRTLHRIIHQQKKPDCIHLLLCILLFLFICLVWYFPWVQLFWTWDIQTHHTLDENISRKR